MKEKNQVKNTSLASANSSPSQSKFTNIMKGKRSNFSKFNKDQNSNSINNGVFTIKIYTFENNVYFITATGNPAYRKIDMMRIGIDFSVKRGFAEKALERANGIATQSNTPLFSETPPFFIQFINDIGSTEQFGHLATLDLDYGCIQEGNGCQFLHLYYSSELFRM